MKALILAGGYGTRLKSIAKGTAKALLKVSGKPIIDHILDHLKTLPHLSEIIIVTNDKFAGDFEAWAQNHPLAEKTALRVVNDGTKSNEERLGSIGDIDFVLNNCPVDDDLLVVGGDNLFDFNIDDYVQFASSKPEHVTIGLFDIKEKARATKFGVVEVDDENRVASFEEKPQQPRSSLIAMCLYYMPRKTLGLIKEYLVQSGKSDRAGDYIVWLMQNGDVFGFEFSGKWFDIGSVESYNDAQNAFQ